MRKGKLGFSLTVYPVVGFLLAIFGQWLLCFLVLGLAMVLEKDEWTTRQCMQAAFLGLVAMVADVISGFFSRLTSFIYDIGSFSYGSTWYITLSNVFDIISLVLRIAILVIVFVFALLSVFKVARGQEANTPIVSGFVYKLFGMLPPQPAPVQYAQQPVYQQQGAPMQQQQPPMQQPVQQQPMQQPPMQQPAPQVQQPVYPQQSAPVQPPAAPVQQPPQNGGQMPPNV